MKLYGKNPVIERLKHNPKSVRKIYLQEGYPDGSYVRKKAAKWKIPVYMVPRSKMVKLSRSIKSQGILADIEDFQYTPYEDLLAKAVEKKNPLVFLDGLNDPQNLGVIIRSLACLGNFSIVLPKTGSVKVTEAVLRVATGGDIFVEIAQVSNLGTAIDQAKSQGFWVVGTVIQGGTDLMETTLPFPTALVIGSEHSGIRQGIRKRLDLAVTIPMHYSNLSFNVGQATTIFCYEIIKQRKQKKKK